MLSSIILGSILVGCDFDSLTGKNENPGTPPTEPDNPDPGPGPDPGTEPEVEQRLIEWMNYGDRSLGVEWINEGTLPVYKGETPQVEEYFQWLHSIEDRNIDAETRAKIYNYSFEGWTPAITKVGKQNVTYTAKYAKTRKDLPENSGPSTLFKVVKVTPQRMVRSTPWPLDAIETFVHKIDFKALDRNPDGTYREVNFSQNVTIMAGMDGLLLTEGYLVGIGRIAQDGDLSVYSLNKMFVEGRMVNGYIPANFGDYHPDLYNRNPQSKDYIVGYPIPKATTPVINGKVINVKEFKDFDYMDKNGEKILYTKGISIDTNGDGKEDEYMTLSPIFLTHREMCANIKNGDPISFRIHQYSDRLGERPGVPEHIKQDIRESGRVFPEDVESYGNYINDRDYAYKLLTGNPNANDTNYWTIEMGTDQYKGKASSLK